MLTATVAQSILDVLAAMMTAGEIFTAYDVTLKARQEVGEEVMIEHRDVREVVHNEYRTGQMGTYCQVAGIELNVPGNPLVIVYFPDGADPYDHPKAMRPRPAGVLPDPVDIDDDDSDDDSTEPASTERQGGADLQDDGSVICSYTAENRINIPKTLMSQILPQGGSYDFTTGRGDFCRSSNADGRIRLRRAELENLGISTDKVRLAADSTANKISVAEVSDDSDDSDN